MDHGQDFANWLIKFLEKECDYAPITGETPLAALALDSYTLYDLNDLLQRKYGYTLSEQIISESRTIGTLISALQNIAPRNQADRLALLLYREISGRQSPETITFDIGAHLTELLASLEKIFELEIPRNAIADRPYIITVTNYIAAKLPPTEVNKRAELFLNLAANEN